MELDTVSPTQDTATRGDQTPRAPACPFCGWALISVRGILRCSGCHFTICEGCEGECLAG